MGNSNSAADSTKASKNSKEDGGSSSTSGNTKQDRKTTTLENSKDSAASPDGHMNNNRRSLDNIAVVDKTVSSSSSEENLHHRKETPSGSTSEGKADVGETIAESVEEPKTNGFAKQDLSSEGTSVDVMSPEKICDKLKQKDTSSSESSSDEEGTSSDSDVASVIETDTGKAEGISVDRVDKIKSSDATPDTSTDDSNTSSDEEDSVAHISTEGSGQNQTAQAKSHSSHENCCTKMQNGAKQTESGTAVDDKCFKHVKHGANSSDKGHKQKRHSHKEENVTYSINSDSDSSIIEVFLECDSVNSLQGENKLQSKADLAETYTISTCLQKTDTLSLNRGKHNTDYRNVCTSPNESPHVSVKNSSDNKVRDNTNKMDKMLSAMAETPLNTGTVLDTEENDMKVFSIGCNLPGLGNIKAKMHQEKEKTMKEDKGEHSERSNEFKVRMKKETVHDESHIEEYNNNHMPVNSCEDNILGSDYCNIDQSMSEQSGFNESCQDMSHNRREFPEKQTNNSFVCSECKTKSTADLCLCQSKNVQENKDCQNYSKSVWGNQTSSPCEDIDQDVPINMAVSLAEGQNCKTDTVSDINITEEDSELSEINRILCSAEPTNHERNSTPNFTGSNTSLELGSLDKLHKTDIQLPDTNSKDVNTKNPDKSESRAITDTKIITETSGKLMTLCLGQLETQCSRDEGSDSSGTNIVDSRSYLSFSGLVSANTLGEETSSGMKLPPKELKNVNASTVTEKVDSDSPLLRRKARHKKELTTDKRKGGSLGSGRKGRSRRSNRGNSQVVKEYWNQHLAKYSTVSDRDNGDLANLRDITNFDVLRTMGRAGCNSVLCASDGDLNASSQEYHKYSKFVQASTLACTDNTDYPTVCSSTGLINRWSSNLSLHSDSSQLIHEDTEKTAAACSVDRHGLSQQEQGVCEREISKNDILSTHNQSEEVCVNPINTDIISSERPHKKCSGKQTGDLQVEQKIVKGSSDTNDVIICTYNNEEENQLKDSLFVDKVKEKLVYEEVSERSSTSSPNGSVRSDGTDSPSSLSVIAKPPSGIKKKKETTTGKHSWNKPVGQVNVSKQSESKRKDKESSAKKKIEREKKNESGHNVTKEDTETSPQTGKRKVKQGPGNDTKKSDNEFEVKMLKTLISNNASIVPSKPEDDVYRKLPLNRSWSGNDFKMDETSEEKLRKIITKTEEHTSSDKGTEAVKKTKMRRTMSDLGFGPTRPNRTASLLKNPVMRKHLARTMGLNPEASEEDVKEAIDEKLESTMKQNNLGLGRSCSTMSLSSRRFEDESDNSGQLHSKLCRTSSLSDGMNSFTERDFRRDKKPQNKGVDEVSLTTDSDEAFLQTKANEHALGKPVQEKTVFRNIRSVSDRNLSRFQIPSFSEFRKSRKLGLPLKSRSSSCFDFIGDETIVEEDIQDMGNPDAKSVNYVTGTGRDDKSYYRNRVHSMSSLNKFHGGKDIVHQMRTQDMSQRSREVFGEGNKHMDIDTVNKDQNINQTSEKGYSVASKSSADKSITGQPKDKTAAVRDKIHPKNPKFYHDVPPCPSSPDQALGDELEPGLDSDTSLVEELRKNKSHTLDSENMRARHWKRREHKFRKKFFPEHEGYVNRSTSDVSDIKAEEERKKALKEKRQKPYNSDPFGKSQSKYRATGFEGDEIKEELLNLVKDVQSCSQQSLESNFTAASSVPSVDSCLDELSSDDKPNPVPPPRRKSKRRKKKKDCHSSGSPEKKESLKVPSTEVEQDTCMDCDSKLEGKESQTEAPPMGEVRETLVCRKCLEKRDERDRIINEILLTETRYGRDLKIIHKEFYIPLKSNGLLSSEQVNTIFLNLEELITINEHFVKKLEDLLGTASEPGHQGLFHIDIGRLFLHSTNMLLAFETYCIDHSDALVALETLEKEKEILRIFLEVSQAENSALRRMHLKAFLMVPVQRIMKYPLLLSRLYKVTTAKHPDREHIKTAKKKIEDILEHINYKTKGTASVRFRRTAVQQLKENAAIYEDLEISKIAMETIGWNKNEINIVYSGKLLLGSMPDLNATKRNKLIKFTSMQAVLLTLGKGPTWETRESEESFPLALQSTFDQVKNCALVLLKEKGGTYTPYREPYYLDKCVIAMDEEIPEVFEVQEMGRLSETYICKSMDHRDTVMWYNHLKYQCHKLGKWRKRRNAMPNIMIELGKT